MFHHVDGLKLPFIFTKCVVMANADVIRNIMHKYTYKSLQLQYIHFSFIIMKNFWMIYNIMYNNGKYMQTVHSDNVKLSIAARDYYRY
jgi:hypothetical protein